MSNLNLLHKKFTIPFAFAMVTLTSCGGGGAGSEAGSSAANSSNIAGDVNAARNLDDLYIDQTNELATITELNIEVRVNTASSFLSVCPEPSAEINVNTFNYDKCMIRASLDNNPRAFKLKLPNHIENLVAIVWFYDVTRQPLVNRWSRSTEKGVAIDSVWQINEKS